MESTKRITPEECVGFYRATGIKPAGIKFNSCGIGVCAKVNMVEDDDIIRWADSVFGRAYRTGFVRGFDHINRFVFAGSKLDGDPRHEQGYADGRACAEAVFAITDWDSQSMAACGFCGEYHVVQCKPKSSSPVTIPSKPLLARAVEMALAK